jgi:hypothetical protein
MNIQSWIPTNESIVRKLRAIQRFICAVNKGTFLLFGEKWQKVKYGESQVTRITNLVRQLQCLPNLSTNSVPGSKFFKPAVAFPASREQLMPSWSSF